MRRFEESERKKGSAQQRPLPTLRVQVVGTFSHQKYVMTTRQTNKCESSVDDGLIHQVSQVIARRMIKLQQ
jgi:hypothetical protein